MASCRAIGAHGAALVPAEARILTHCNAGALATAGYGTALGVIRGAVEAGRKVRVLADETRPFLQGARLTAWELVKDGIDTTVITDNMAGAIMRAGDIDLVVVGADRIAANGDTANKIGTYSVAVLAKEHGIPFYVAAPWSTIDLATQDGDAIPIEERHAARGHARRQQPARARRRAACAIPSFDVTPAQVHHGDHHRDAASIAPPFENLTSRSRNLRSEICNVDPRHRNLLRRNRRGARRGSGGRPSRWQLRSNIVASQVDIHREWGGVVPELASRQHVRDICGVVERALADGGAAWRDIDALAVTQGPGLVGSLLVGVSFAKAAAWALEQAAGRGQSPGRPHRVDLARTRPDRAAGDRAGRVGRAHQPLSGQDARASISCSAARATMRRARRTTRWRSCCRSAIRAGRSSIGWRARATTTAIRWPGTRLTNPDRNAPERDGRFDFSFSGLKTAVLRHVRQRQAELGVEQLPQQEIVDLAASFQRRVVETLIDRAFAAARWHGAKSIGIAGGVSANSRLRADALAKAERSEIPVYIPRLSLSTDNAAMIAAAGMRQLAAGRIRACRPQRGSFAAALTRTHEARRHGGH